MRLRHSIDRIPPAAMLVIWAFAIITLLVAIFVPFPSNYDELQHLSVIRAQYEHPGLFADPGRYFVLRQDDVTRWSATRNYINHPSLYYLAMSAYLHVTDSIVVARAINAVLAAGTLMLVVWAGLSRFATRAGQTAFAVLAAGFPKAALIGGMINNDNLAGFAGGIVFAGLLRGSGLLLGVGLALAGWTKLTALIALGAVVAVERGWRMSRGDTGRDRDALAILAGAALGALPYVVSLAETGHLFYVNEQVYGAAPGQRPVPDFLGYAFAFVQALAMKWSASEYVVPLWAAIGLLAVPLALMGIGIAKDRQVARTGLAYAIAIAVTLVIHLCFGWASFERIGDQTIAQTRYYNVLWPGVALAGAAGVVTLARISQVLGVGALLLVAAPTIVGCGLWALVAG